MSEQTNPDRGSEDVTLQDRAPQDQGPAQLLRNVVQQAIVDAASDVHLESRQDGLLVRYRVDGVLREAMRLPSEMAAPLVRSARIWADLDLEEHARPQEGWVVTKPEGGARRDLRFSVMPHTCGHDVVIRIIDPEMAAAWSWEGIGLADRNDLEALLRRPRGLVIFAGPTGSGKTTVLYAGVKLLDAEKLNIAMVDDEISLRVQGVNRVPAAYASEDAIRTLLARHDLDVLALPEIESRTGAELALEAGASRLALANLYADDAIHALERLRRWGVSPHVMTGGLAGVVSSRLARRVCKSCKQGYTPDEAAVRALGLSPGQNGDVEFKRGAGCEACHKTGYRGRIGFYEGFVLDSGLKRLVEASANESSLRAHARQQGMRTLRDDAIAAVLRGDTSVEEAVRALGPRAR